MLHVCVKLAVISTNKKRLSLKAYSVFVKYILVIRFVEINNNITETCSLIVRLFVY